MQRFRIAAAGILLWFCLFAQASGQSANATLSGTVSDAARALIPGVSITASNTATGVVASALTNETGTYTFPSLLPGVYTVSAELPGFQVQTFTDVRLGSAAQVRLNFTLQVAGLATAIEVVASADRLLLESTSSVGGVLPEQTVRDLPLVGPMGNDALDLVRTLPGINLAANLINNANDSRIAGVSAANVQIQRDGVDASAAGRWPAGIQAATIINPDLVGEIRMILAPVDAEVGHGNSQIQVQTRSGTNRFSGAAVWNIRNSALDPNTWANNRVHGEPNTRSWTNNNQYTVSVGGPIVPNRTFFFALWDGMIPAGRTNVNATVLTPCAARGIFRYYDNWANGNALQATTSGATPRIAVVDQAGNPMAPAINPNGSAHNGVLRYASVFGPLMNTPAQPDCSDAVVAQGQPWDPYRTQMDPSGYVASVLGVMPPANNYDVGDGLNTAGHRWVRPVRGMQNRFGFGWGDVRKQINTKIDHHFNSNHKMNAAWSSEWISADYGQTQWPTARFDGVAFRRPTLLTVNFTSTLSPTLVNEARFGLRRTGTNTVHGLAHNPAARDFVPNVQGIPIVQHLGLNAVNQNPVICFCGGQPLFQTEAGNLFNGNISETTPLYSFVNTVSWLRGTHTFKAGGEVRFASSRFSDDVEGNNWSTFARAFGGETQFTPIQGINSANMPGIQGTSTTGNVLAMRGLMTLLSGSLARVTQLYYLGSADRLDRFDDYRDSVQRTRQLNQREYSFFFKDDWKATQNLTLNLGLRWDYFGVPWVSNGLTVSPAGGGDALFGYSGRGFENWMRPERRGDDTQLIFVGPGSPNPDISVWNKDFNNFGPAVGFAWQVPWFGDPGQTTVRGGYQINYLIGGGRFNTLNGPLANPPGSSYQATITGASGLEYLDLTRLSQVVPVAVPVQPMEPIGVENRQVSLTAIDSGYTTPYVQNLTMAVTRNIGRNLSVDVRYIGTLGRKLYDSININAPNFLFNGLLDAFEAARHGGESELLNSMFQGINIAGSGHGPVGTVVNGVPQTGALHLRNATASNIRNNLANGNYSALANTLSTLIYSKAAFGNASLPDIPVGENGAVLRYNGFPENFIKTNPQFNNANLLNNSGNTNYHSLQTQATLRPTVGINLQASYTWSKLLGNTGATYTNPVDRRGDYTLQTGDRRHDFRTNGTFGLPIGPNQPLLGGSSGVMARIMEGWKVNWIFRATSGAPSSISAQSMLYGNGVPDVAGSFDPKGKVRWEDGAVAGNFFGSTYQDVRDPQCDTIAMSLRSACTLGAIADLSGNIVLQNPLPGMRGTLGQNVIELPGIWELDAGMSKAVSIGEGKRLLIRMDALNIFNHPQPANPTLNINSSVPFGNIATKTGVRELQGQLRLEF